MECRIMKKVLLVVIDALSTRHVKTAFADHRLPTLKRLVELGEMHEQCVSIFPSITPAATASIITGVYPCDHGILGAFFYNTEEDHVYFFGDDIWVVLRKGSSEFFNEFLISLNQDLLSAETLFEKVERQGKRAASLNYLIYRGAKRHTVNVPWLLRLMPGIPWKEEVPGPDLLCLGDFVTGKPRPDDAPLSAPGGPFHRFGFEDDSTGALLLEMERENAWRDLTVAYFPDNDYVSHDQGPTAAISTLEKVDSHLGKLFEEAGGVEAFLKHTAIVITGDHAQIAMVEDNHSQSINLEEILEPFSPVSPGGDWTSDDQLMICPNMRACQIYLRRNRWNDLDAILDRLLSESRIDQILWRDDRDPERTRFHVLKQDAGRMAFWRSDPNTAQGRDPFGNSWQWEGALETIDAKLADDGMLQYGDYPNALERIATSFARPAGGDMWLTARPGHEFRLLDTEIHEGGSHGSLHTDDSSAPMILAGAPEGVTLPEHLRIVDTPNLCLRILGLSD